MPYEINAYEIPIAIRALRTASIYILNNGNKTILVDTGMDEHIDTFLKSKGVKIENIDMVFLTHLHIDHLGGVNKLSQSYGLNGYIGKNDLKRIEVIQNSSNKFITWQVNYLKRNGVPDKMLENIGENHPIFSELKNYMALRMDSFDFIRTKIGDFNFLDVPGHSPGSTCFMVNNNSSLFSGDHILERISPNISYYDEDEDMLGEYLASLAKTKNDQIMNTFPGHGLPLGNPNRRIDQLIRHHEDRMKEIRELARNGWLTSYEVAKKMKWSKGRTMETMNMMETNFAIGEAISHLRHMEKEGIIDMRETGGVYSYRSK